MGASKKGFVDKTGVFRSYKEIINAAKRQVSDNNEKGIVTDEWMIELSELSPKDKVNLDLIIEERKVPVSDVAEKTVTPEASETLIAPVGASGTSSPPVSALTFDDVLHGHSKRSESITKTVPENNTQKEQPLSPVVPPHSLITGGGGGGKYVEMADVKNSAESNNTNTVLIEEPVFTTTVNDEEPDEVYPITIFEKKPRHWGSGSSWFASVYLFFSLTVLGTVFFVFNQLASNLKLDLSFTNAGEKLFLLISALGFVSIVLGVIGIIRANKDGFSKKLSIIGITLSTITFVSFFVLFNIVFPLLTYPGL